MQASPRRLRRLAARPLIAGPAAPGAWPQGALFGGERRSSVRRIRATRRLALVALWTLLSMAVQGVCLALPGRPKVWFARLYWNWFCRIIGLQVRVAGSRTCAGRPLVFVSNHSSWLDIPVLGGQFEACFVSKDDVTGWPLVGTIARLGRSVFVSRQRHATGRERDVLQRRLADGDSLVLFPEGTTSDGSRVLPFRSSFFALAEGGNALLIQPVSVVYDRLGGLPTGRAARPLFAWYGDMDIASHFWRLAQYRGLRATVLLHPPIDSADFADRKALAQAVWSAVADGASTLRQNRPPHAPGNRQAGEDATPAYA